MTRTEELSYATRFAADGVVCCRGLLDRSGLEYAESAYPVVRRPGWCWTTT